jgi:hypothetical protein
MATFTITTPTLITELTGKTGADTYNINGGSLTIDCDSRYAPNATSTTGPIGNLTVDSALGGHFQVTTENTKLLQFNSGSGTVPAYGTVITQGGASAVLLCVMATKTGGTVYAAGAGMPNAGWLKVRVTAPGFGVGALSGISASLSTPFVLQGWIVVVGEETRTHSHARLGTMQMRGDWVDIGTTNGVVGQTMQLPHFTADGATYYPGVEVETAPGSGVFDFWPNAGTRHTSANCSTDSRSSFVYISTTGLVTFGMGTDALAAGYVPASGCDVRIPSIILQNCGTTSRQTTVEPNRTMGSRYESAYTNAGVLDVRKVTGAWYWNTIQAYSTYIRDLHVCDNILMGECATAMDIDGLHQGLSTSATDFNSNGIVIQQSYNGGTVGSMSWLRATSTATSSYAAILVNLYGGWAFGKLRGGHVGAVPALAGALYYNTCGPTVIDEIWTFAKRVLVQAADNLRILRHVYADNNVGTTGTVAQSRAVETVGQSVVVTVDNIENWPGVANCHPYLALLYCNTTQKATLRNCGTAAAPYNAGTVNAMGYIFDDGGNNDRITLQRNWTTALRLGLHGGTNTTRRMISVNNYMTDASKTIGPQQLDSVVHGNRFNSGGVPNSYSSVYGNAMWDGFTGDTTTRAALILAEKSAANANAYQITAGNPRFTGAGRAVFTTAGDQIVWTWPWKILGWTGLTSHAIQGQNTASHALEYALDTTGAGFGAWKTLNTTNLVAETGIDPVAGFGLRLRVTCTASSTTNRIDSLLINGTTTLALQNAALYPLEGIGLTLDGLVPGSDVVVLDAGTTTVLDTGDSVGSTSYTYSYLAPHTVDIAVYLQGFEPYYLRGYLLSADPVTLPISQKLDRNFSLA